MRKNRCLQNGSQAMVLISVMSLLIMQDRSHRDMLNFQRKMESRSLHIENDVYNLFIFLLKNFHLFNIVSSQLSHILKSTNEISKASNYFRINFFIIYAGNREKRLPGILPVQGSFFPMPLYNYCCQNNQDRCCRQNYDSVMIIFFLLFRLF